MGKVVLARVDSRLIHGQVATNVSKSVGANALFVADDVSAHDEFTKNIIDINIINKMYCNICCA